MVKKYSIYILAVFVLLMCVTGCRFDFTHSDENLANPSPWPTGTDGNAVMSTDSLPPIVPSYPQTTSVPEYNPQITKTPTHSVAVSTNSPSVTTVPTSMATPTPTQKVLNAPKLAEKTAYASKVEKITYNGSVSSNSQKVEYTYTAKESGRVRFEINEMKSGIVVYLNIYDHLDECIASNNYCDNNDGVTIKVEKGVKLKIVVQQQKEFGNFQLNIWQPKASINVNNYSKVRDSIEFVDQRNIYTFTVPVDGYYKFYVNEMKSGAYVSIYIIDRLDEIVYKSDFAYNNGNGIVSEKLKAGATYQIQVLYQSYSSVDSPEYTLNIGKHKPTVEISSYAKINDCIQYEDQVIYYHFTVPENGSYYFQMTEMQSDLVYHLAAYDYLDEKVAGNNRCKNNGGFWLNNVQKGDVYRIVVSKVSVSDKTVGSYTMLIKQ